MLVVQASVQMSRIATVTALVAWSQFFGGAIALSLAQTLFENLLRSRLHVYAPEVNVQAIVTAGATGFASVVPPEYQHNVQLAYNDAIAHTYYLGIGVAAASVFTGLLVGSTKAATKKTTAASDAAAGGEK
jgi:hypothetical protein